MKVTLTKDGIYGKKGDVVELGTKKAIELGLVESKSEDKESKLDTKFLGKDNLNPKTKNQK